jgi:hypothetical protein
VPSGLQPGDVLLYCPRDPDTVQAGIARAQEFILGPSHACFTHVAIYAGAGMVHDATPSSQVATRALHQMHVDGWLRARRLDGVTPPDQTAICTQAAAIVASKARYSKLQAAVHGMLAASAVLAPDWQMAINVLVQATQGKQDRIFYCSGFLQRVHLRSVGFGAWHPHMVAPLPASFSVTAKWSEVSISW